MSAGRRLSLIAIVALAGAGATPAPGRIGDARAVVRCQVRVARAAERIVRQRQRALATCLDATPARCAAALGKAAAMVASLSRAAAPCRGRAIDATLGLDGIGWAALAPVCPEAAIGSLGDVVACLERALSCAADVAVADAVPEVLPRLAERGVAIDRQCLDPAVCGNAVREGDEECDDGNRVAGDGCDAQCRVEVPATCGNGVLDPGEECDDGPANSDVLPDRCRTTCRDPDCGDGVLDPGDGEECEPPRTATCDEDCFLLDVGATRAAAATPAGSCQVVLARAVGRVTRKVQREVDGCALALARCSLVDDDPSARCLMRAEDRCRTAARRRAATPGRVAGTFARWCDERPGAITMRLAHAACAAEAAVSRSIPRADELMLTELLDLDGDEAFPCVIDLSDLE